LPAPVATIVSRLPMWPLEQLLTRTLDFGVGRVVSRDAVVPLIGRRFSLCVRDLGVTVQFEGTPMGFRPARPPYAPDLSITATLRDYIALGLREEDPDTLFFARRLSIEGDTDLGLTVKNLLDGIDWGTALRSLAASLPQPLRHLVPGR
jgi:predicted lipid carrier protein YhbT